MCVTKTFCNLSVMNDCYSGKLFCGLLYYLEFHRPVILRGLPEGLNEFVTIETIIEVVGEKNP